MVVASSLVALLSYPTNLLTLRDASVCSVAPSGVRWVTCFWSLSFEAVILNNCSFNTVLNGLYPRTVEVCFASLFFLAGAPGLLLGYCWGSLGLSPPTLASGPWVSFSFFRFLPLLFPCESHYRGSQVIRRKAELFFVSGSASSCSSTLAKR